MALAIAAAYSALDLASRVRAAQHRTSLIWLSGGAVAMGAGIWAMHYGAMLAFRLPVPVFFHYPTILLSLLAAIAACWVALFTISRERMDSKFVLAAGITIGVGIAAMQYIGILAMRLPAVVEYLWPRVAISIALAVAISCATLVLVSRLRQDKSIFHRLMGALGMGGAFPLIHYSGMWSVRLHSSDTPFGAHATIHVSSLGLAFLVLAGFLIMILAILPAFVDRLIAAQMAFLRVARDGKVPFETLAEAIPQIVWIADANGQTTYINQHWYELTGMAQHEGLGLAWTDMIHPDDRAPCAEKWRQCQSSGETFEFEYRLHESTKGYRWYLDRAVPLRDNNGVIQQWFGTCTDIEEQKHHQQELERQIQERTEELAEANSRLQEEMWEKDLAHRKLDEQNEKMVHELTGRSQRATLLAQMGELLQSCTTREEVFAAALGFAPKIFPARRGAIALFNSGRNLVEVAGQWHECQLPQPAFEPESCWALRTGHPHLVVAGDTTACCAHATGVKNTYVCVPILAQGEALGVLHVQAADENETLTEAELSLKTTFASQVGLSVANLRLREALRSQSIRDPLTGLYNRRYLQEMMERETRRAVRAEHGLGVIMLDLDHFKKFNDTYGHDAGDTVLREAASFLVKSVRAEDIVCRFGGEEFMVILPMADLSATNARAGRIRSKLREMTVLHHGQSLGIITVSVGVAGLPDHGTTPQVLIEAADGALYRAKREGRDRVVVADLPAPVVTLPQGIAVSGGPA